MSPPPTGTRSGPTMSSASSASSAIRCRSSRSASSACRLLLPARLGLRPGQLDVFYVGVVPPVRHRLILIDSAMAGEWEIFSTPSAHGAAGTAPRLRSLAYISAHDPLGHARPLSREYGLHRPLRAPRAEGRMGHALRNAAIPLVTVIALSYRGCSKARCWWKPSSPGPASATTSIPRSLPPT